MWTNHVEWNLDWVILQFWLLFTFRRHSMIEKIKEKWDEILLHIKEEHELTDVSFKTWLLPTQPYSMKDGTLQILVPDVQFLGYIKKNTDF